MDYLSRVVARGVSFLISISLICIAPAPNDITGRDIGRELTKEIHYAHSIKYQSTRTRKYAVVELEIFGKYKGCL